MKKKGEGNSPLICLFKTMYISVRTETLGEKGEDLISCMSEGAQGIRNMCERGGAEGQRGGGSPLVFSYYGLLLHKVKNIVKIK